MGIEPTSGMETCRSTVLKTVAPRDATSRPDKGSVRMNDTPSLSLPYGSSEEISDMAEVIDAWPTLPEPIQAGILAMIRSASGKGPRG
jgi:hypothetical protein